MNKFFRSIILMVSVAMLCVPIIAPELNVHVLEAVCATGATGLFAIATYQMNIMGHLTGNLGAVEVEMWSDWIANNLFKGIEFLKNCFRADDYVLKGKVVHIPQAGSKPAVVINRTTLPATAVKRNDTDVTYALDEYTTDPVNIEDAANVQLSYSKMESVFGDHIGALNETICDKILIAWAPSLAANMIRTTGANVTAHLPIATGTRKALTLADIKKAAVTLNKQKVNKLNRFCVMSEDMWSQLEEALSVTPTRDYSKLNDVENGVIAKLYGFSIVTTPNVVAYDNAATPVVKAFGAAGAITDNDAVLCYQKDCLEMALGDIKFFEQKGAPQMFGDVYSALVRMGGRKRYATEIGVVAIIQVP